MRPGVAQGGLVPLCCSVCIWTTYRHVELAQYAVDMAPVATSCSPSLLVGYLDTCLGRFEHWLRDWGIATNVPKSTSVIFVKTASRSPDQSRFSEGQYSGSKRHDTLGWLLINSLPCRFTWTRWKRRQLKDCPSDTVCCSTSSSSVLWWITHVRSGSPLPAATSGSCKCYNSSVFALRLTYIGTLVTGKFTRIWGSILRRLHQSTDWEFRLNLSWYGERLSSETSKALVPSKSWLKSPMGYWGALMLSMPAEAVSAQQVKRVVSDYSATLMFSVLFLSFKANARA
jgi:hypothetical protein